MVSPSQKIGHLTDAERAELESWLLEFDQRWDADRLAAKARELPAGGALRLSALAEMVKIDLERQWQRGHRVRVEDYLAAFPELGSAADPPLDLIETEVDVRTQFDDRPNEAELASRFPGAGDVLRQLLSRTAGVPQSSLQTSAAGANPSTLNGPGRDGRELSGRFGRYEIRRLLGRGGMGAVYLADDTQLDRPVALKVPHFSRPGDAEARERFRREGRAAAALDHPHLCRVFDVGEHAGVPFLTMAYIEGRPLGDPADGPLPAERVAALVRKVALALAYAHARGVIHRDLKPSNILIDARGEPVVTDFGLARREGAGDAQLSRAGVPLGTPAYMSPEQVAGRSEAIGPPSDIFSLGVILYQLLAGRLPFHGGPAEVMVQIVVDHPPLPSSLRPDTDPRLEAACLKAMAKEPGQRFASMEAFAAALSSDAPAPPAPRARRRVRVLAGAATALAVVAGVLIIQCNGSDTGTKEPVVPNPKEPPDQKPTVLETAPPPHLAVVAPVVFRGHSKAVTAVAFAPDGRVASADEGGVRVWDTATGKEWTGPKRESRGGEGLTFSPEGRRYVDHWGQSIELHETDTGKALLRNLEGGPHTGMTAFSASGRRVVIAKMGALGKSAALVWDLEENKTYRFANHVELELIAAVALSADGKRGVSASLDGVRVWEVESGKESRHWANLRVTAVAFTPDGKQVLTGNALGSLVLRDPATGTEVGRFDGHTAGITAVAFSADGERLLSASTDGTARIWAAKTGEQLQRLDGHAGAVLSVALSADGATALTGGKDGTVRLWGVRRGNP